MQELDKVIESEREVLGNIIKDNSLILKTIGTLREDDFYRGPHQLLYKTMKELYKQDNNFDAVILLNKLKDKIKENLITVTEISNISLCGIKSTFKSHLEAVIESSRQRKISKLMQNVANSEKNSEEKINYIQDELMKMNVETEGDKILTTKDLMRMTADKVQEAYESKGGITGVPTGINILDNAMNGLERQDMIVLAARPSMGKTAIVLKILENIQGNALLVQLDMGLKAIGCRMLATDINMENGRISRGKLEDNEWIEFTKSLNRLARKDNLFFYSPSSATIGKIRTKAKQLKIKHGLDVIILDHIGKLKPEIKGSKYEQASDNSNKIKQVARELDVAFVALSQLSRAVEQRQDKHPILADLRDSGSIEEDADTIGMLYREGYYTAREKGEKIRSDTLELSFQKVRNGRLGTVKFHYDLETQKLLPLNE
ncbi:DNA helicase [Clostridium beijerinckii]|uniref:replicative DNA helicase n=1 Tax=Clostridium beijerinckii TaxID=1520 RepID=UPI002226BC21|nr:DnaB-like helicase C-terminal domain-containing protein [Clostridium beijerinckii]UYZ34981.1 DNA helicase [Clostridium beijerinckii]